MAEWQEWWNGGMAEWQEWWNGGIAAEWQNCKMGNGPIAGMAGMKDGMVEWQEWRE